MKKIVAISTIVAVTMILTIGYVVPQVAATHDPSHRSPLYLAGEVSDVCISIIPGQSQCAVVVDVNRNGLCDSEDRTILLLSHVATTLPKCPSPDED